MEEWTFEPPGAVTNREVKVSEDGEVSVTVSFDDGTVLEVQGGTDLPVRVRCNQPLHIDKAAGTFRVAKD